MPLCSCAFNKPVQRQLVVLELNITGIINNGKELAYVLQVCSDSVTLLLVSETDMAIVLLELFVKLQIII